MFDDINTALKTYFQAWQQFASERTDKTYFTALKPTAVAWKTEDLKEFDDLFARWREQCDQIHQVWINERWLATMHLKDTSLEGGIKIIKLMQRRPGSTDAVGLDHVDFLHKKDAENVLQKEDIKWTRESNNDFCSWLSIWFAGTEAKLRTNTVLDVCIAELNDANKKVA
jgi:hypothetical protein